MTDIDALNELFGKTTQGEWEVSGIRSKFSRGTFSYEAHQVGPAGNHEEAVCAVYYSDLTNEMHRHSLADAQFIAQSHNAWPQLYKRLIAAEAVCGAAKNWHKYLMSNELQLLELKGTRIAFETALKAWEASNE